MYSGVREPFPFIDTENHGTGSWSEDTIWAVQLVNLRLTILFVNQDRVFFVFRVGSCRTGVMQAAVSEK
jgi:hypothetical protein